jgi:CheY-like chemotaxis protein
VVLCADQVSRHAWQLELEARGWQASAATDIKSAIDAAIRFQPQAIVTTVQLPDLTGYHFVRTLRSVIEHDIKVVGVGQSSPDTADAGFDHFVEPPLDFDAVGELIAVATNDPQERLRTKELQRIDP